MTTTTETSATTTEATATETDRHPDAASVLAADERLQQGRLAVAVRANCTLAPGQDPAVLEISTPLWSRPMRLGNPAVVKALSTLQSAPTVGADLLLEVTAGEGGMARAGLLQAALGKLHQVAVLDHVLLDASGQELGRLTTEGVRPITLAATAPQTGRLSPLAVVTVRDGAATIQSGLSHLRVVLDPTLLGTVCGEDLLATPAGALLGRLLSSANLWEETEATDREHRQWSAVELWMHRQSHDSTSVDAYGGTFHLAQDFPPLDFGRPAASTTVPLPEPDLAALRRDDIPLAEAMESRRSIRDFTDEAPTLAQIGELLYRSVRARGVFRAERGVEVVDRPYPSGGSVHELEVYVVAPGSEHLDRGLWRYAPDRHALDLVTDEEAAVSVLVRDLQQAATLEQPAPIGLLVTARFGRLMWKYQGMAYALILKHVGVLYQTLYLNATAMGLGVCGLGGAATSSFATASGLDPLAEGVVGGLVAGHPGSVPESPWSAT